MDRHGGSIARRAPRFGRSCALLGLALIALALMTPRKACARNAPRAPRIVWSTGGRLYLASPDSGSFSPGMVVHVFKRNREIALGEVTRVLDGVMACVRLTRGILDADARFDRFEIRLESAPARALGALRVGLPSPARIGLAFTCPDGRLDPSSLPRAYRAETLAVDACRLVATDSAAAARAWPETLYVRTFGDRADEEIALERGELDLAVFWPGEPSARLRQGASGYETLLGERARGLLVASDAPHDSLLARRVGPDMAALNAGMFAGDLLPWPRRKGPGDEPVVDIRGTRYRVDATVPGQHPLERFLDRRQSAPARSTDRVVRLTCLDEPVSPRDSLEAAWQARGVLPLFTLRCPELCRPELSVALRGLGPDAFANLLRCGAGGKRP